MERKDFNKKKTFGDRPFNKERKDFKDRPFNKDKKDFKERVSKFDRYHQDDSRKDLPLGLRVSL